MMKTTALLQKLCIAIIMLHGSVFGLERRRDLGAGRHTAIADAMERRHRPDIISIGPEHSGPEIRHIPTSDGPHRVRSIGLQLHAFQQHLVHVEIDSDNQWKHLEEKVNQIQGSGRTAGNTSDSAVVNAVRQEILASKHKFKRKRIESAGFKYFIESIDPANPGAGAAKLNFGNIELLAPHSSGPGGLGNARAKISGGLSKHGHIDSAAMERMELVYESASATHAAAQQLSTNWRGFEQGLDRRYDMTQLEKLIITLVVPPYNRAVDAFIDLIDTLNQDQATMLFQFQQLHHVYTPMTEEMEQILLDFQFQQVSAIVHDMATNLKQSDEAAKVLKKMIDLKTESLEVEQIRIQKQMEQNVIEAAKLPIKQKALKESLQLAQTNLVEAQKNYDAKVRHKEALERRKRDMKCKWYTACLNSLIHAIAGDIKETKNELREIDRQLAEHRAHHAQLQSNINSLNSQLKTNDDQSHQLDVALYLLRYKVVKLSETSVEVGLLQKDMAAAVFKIGGLLSGTATFDNVADLDEALIPFGNVGEKLGETVSSHVLLVLPQLSPEDKQLIEENLKKWKEYNDGDFDIDDY